MLASPQRRISGRVLFHMLTVGVCTGVVKIAGAAKVVLTARAFGVSDGLDAYLIAFLFPSFVSDIFTGSLVPALVPAYIEVREKAGRAAAVRLYSSVLAGAAGLLTVVSLVLAALSPWVLRPLALSFDAAKMSLTVSLFLVMLATLPMSALANTWRAILNAEERFVAAAFAGIMTPLTAIVFLLRFGHVWGVYALAAGTLCGAFFETSLLAIAVKSRGYPLFPRWTGRSPELNRVLEQYAPLVAGTLLLGGAPMIDQAIAAMLGSGSVAALQYGTRLCAVLGAMGPAAVATAILPHFSKMHAMDEARAARRSLPAYAVLIVSVTLPAVAALMIFSPQLIRLFFERGQFTGSNTDVVATVQRYSLLALPITMVLSLVLRYISSARRNHLLIGASALGLVVNLVLDVILARWIGVAGIALSTAAVQAVTLGYLMMRLRRPVADTASTHIGGTPDSPQPEATLETGARGGR